MVAETSEASKDTQKVLAVKTTRARTVQNLQFVISAEKATFQREKCFALL